MALGTSLPDTFASKSAAVAERTADNAIGNVTGSNSVNVFLGLGLPWMIASIYHVVNVSQIVLLQKLSKLNISQFPVKDSTFRVESGSLGFTVSLYSLVSILGVGILMSRRMVSSWGGAELGGPTFARYFSSFLLLSLWFIYIVCSSMHSYGHFKGLLGQFFSQD